MSKFTIIMFCFVVKGVNLIILLGFSNFFSHHLIIERKKFLLSWKIFHFISFHFPSSFPIYITKQLISSSTFLQFPPLSLYQTKRISMMHFSPNFYLICSIIYRLIQIWYESNTKLVFFFVMIYINIGILVQLCVGLISLIRIFIFSQAIIRFNIVECMKMSKNFLYI